MLIDSWPVAPRLLAIEGAHKAGKSTLAAAVCQRLSVLGVDHFQTDWSATWLSAAFRRSRRGDGMRDPHRYFAWQTAELCDRFRSDIGPALERGLVVVTDRYTLTLRTRGLVRGIAQDVVDAVAGGFPEAGLTVLVVSPDVASAWVPPEKTWRAGFSVGETSIATYGEFQQASQDALMRLRPPGSVTVDRAAVRTMEEVPAVAEDIVERFLRGGGG